MPRLIVYQCGVYFGLIDFDLHYLIQSIDLVSGLILLTFIPALA